MELKTLNKTLRQQAIDNGLCEGWQRMWRCKWDRDELIQKFKEGIDFCIKNKYPSNEFIKENFTRDILRKHSILVDDHYSLLNQRMCVLQGGSTSNIRYNGWNPGTVYIRGNSYASITARQMSFVIVHLFDNAVVDCRAEDKASIVVLRHGENTKANTCIGNVKVKDELGYLS